MQSMANVVNLAKHRRSPGTAWWTGWVCCHVCGDEHVAVVPIPDWAESPPATECPRCHGLSCLPVADDALDQIPQDAFPWCPPDPEPVP